MSPSWVPRWVGPHFLPSMSAGSAARADAPRTSHRPPGTAVCNKNSGVTLMPESWQSPVTPIALQQCHNGVTGNGARPRPTAAARVATTLTRSLAPGSSAMPTPYRFRLAEARWM